MTYNKFVWPPLLESLTTYDANNHVLHTFLCKLSVRWFGLSEFGMRVPSLAGGLLFLISIWRLARYVFGRGWFCLFAVAAVTLNPLVLDYLSAARGYSLALGFFFWGLFLLTRYLAEDYDPPVRLLFRAGIAFGLSVAANLVFVVPVAAAGGVFTLMVLLSPDPARFIGRFWRVVDRFWGPALVPAFILLVLPLVRAGSEHFYYGAKSLEDMTRSLVVNSLMHKLSVWDLGRYLPRFGDWPPAAAHVVAPALALLAGIAALAAAAHWARARDLRKLTTVERSLALLAGTMGLSLSALIAAHALAGVLYPLGRTGIYWPPLFTMTCMLAIAYAWRAGVAGKAVATACAPVFVVSIALFAAGFTTDQYPEWRYDAGTMRIVNLLREQRRTAPDAPVRIGANWLLESSLNFYRHKYHLDWMEPVTRNGPAGDYDYYLLLPKDEPLVNKLGLLPIYKDPVSQATLAARTQ